MADKRVQYTLGFTADTAKAKAQLRDLQNQLETMALYLPNEKAQCEYIWKPVYEEYRRIGYRLKGSEQGKLF